MTGPDAGRNIRHGLCKLACLILLSEMIPPKNTESRFHHNGKEQTKR